MVFKLLLNLPIASPSAGTPIAVPGPKTFVTVVYEHL